MERKLASLQIIEDIKPIIGANSIEVATVLGWKCVVRKGEFNAGDKCVYFEIDSVIPQEAKYADFLGEDRRIRTRRFKGQISQGLVLPAEIVSGEYTIGCDLTTLLGIKEYEPVKTYNDGEIAGNFPTYLIPKTDEVLIQSYPGLLDELRGEEYYITQKIDGQSMTIIYVQHELMVASRNCLRRDGDNVFWNIVRKYKMQEFLKDFCDTFKTDLAVQAEVYGYGINKNRMGIKGIDLAVFDMYEIKSRYYYGFWSLQGGSRSFELPMVPIIEEGFEFSYTMDQLVELASGQKYPNGYPAEGIVVRPKKRRYSETIDCRLSFKVLNPKFLLKEN